MITETSVFNHSATFKLRRHKKNHILVVKFEEDYEKKQEFVEVLLDDEVILKVYG